MIQRSDDSGEKSVAVLLTREKKIMSIQEVAGRVTTKVLNFTQQEEFPFRESANSSYKSMITMLGRSERLVFM